MRFFRQKVRRKNGEKNKEEKGRGTNFYQKLFNLSLVT